MVTNVWMSCERTWFSFILIMLPISKRSVVLASLSERSVCVNVVLSFLKRVLCLLARSRCISICICLYFLSATFAAMFTYLLPLDDKRFASRWKSNASPATCSGKKPDVLVYDTTSFSKSSQSCIDGKLSLLIDELGMLPKARLTVPISFLIFLPSA